ncbi:hypothetical protein NUSPORA_02021 [Nucleospora cyclopteri]
MISENEGVLDKYYPQNKKFYIEKTFQGTPEEYKIVLNESKCIFVNNIPLHVREERLWNLFQLIGPIEKVIMGVDQQLMFVGFAFVIFRELEHANKVVKLMNNIKIDGISLRLDKDMGFAEDRRFGRGEGGKQMKKMNRKKFKR